MYVPGWERSAPAASIVAYDPVPWNRVAGGSLASISAAGVLGTRAPAVLRDALAIQAAARDRAATSRPAVGVTPPSIPAPPPSPPVVAAAPNPIDWPAGDWATTTVDATHPLHDVCGLFKSLKSANTSALAGVNFGPLAKDSADPAYVTFKDSIRQMLNDVLAKEPGARKRDLQQKINDVNYDRILSANASGNVVATVLMTVQDGRCVAYWFIGSSSCWAKFTDEGLGKARLTTPQGTSQPAGG